MKKRICVLLSALLLAAMLCACGAAPEKAVVGEWNWTVDMTDYMAAQMGEIEGLDMGSTKMQVVCNLSLNEDKTYHMTVDRDATMASFEGYIDKLKTGLVDALYAMAGEGMSREEVNEMFKESAGMTIEEYVDSAFEQFDLEEALEDLADQEESGTFKVTDDKIYFPADSDDYFVFTLEENTMTLESMSGNPMDFSEIIDEGMGTFPQTLTRR